MEHTEMDIKLDHGWKINLSGLLVLEFGTLSNITFFLWIWKNLGIL